MFENEDKGTQAYIDRLNRTFEKYAYLFEKANFFMPITEIERQLGFKPEVIFNHTDDEELFRSTFCTIDCMDEAHLELTLNEFQHRLGLRPMDINEVREIQSIFDHEAYAGLLIKSSSIKDGPHPSLTMKMSFENQAQYDLFIHDIVPQLGCRYKTLNEGSKKQLVLNIQTLKTDFSRVHLESAFERCRLSVIDAGFYDIMGYVFLEALKNSKPEPPHHTTTQKIQEFPYIILKVDKNGAFYVAIHRQALKEGECFCRPDELKLVGEVLPMLAAQEDPAIRPQAGRKGVFFNYKEGKDFDRYEFYMTPEQLHTILMRESFVYQGYRYGYSLFDLAHPEQELMKQLEGETLCLFPVYDTSENDSTPHVDLLIRNSGCNLSEVISYQVSLLLKHYLPEKYDALASYGHYASPVIGTLGVNDDDLIQAALLSVEIPMKETFEKTSAGDHQGLTSIALARHVQHHYLKAMTPRAKLAMKDAAVSEEELDKLLSLEVPKQRYLQQLINLLIMKKNKSAHEEGLATLETAIKDLTTVIERINQEQTNSLSAGLKTTGFFGSYPIEEPAAPRIAKQADDDPSCTKPS